MNPTHTPTPWNVRKEDDGRVTIYQEGAPYENVVLSHEPAYGNRPYKGVEADAAYIVKCVNAHDELLTALKVIINGAKWVNGTHNTIQDKYLEIARQAISKAEGK